MSDYLPIGNTSFYYPKDLADNYYRLDGQFSASGSSGNFKKFDSDSGPSVVIKKYHHPFIHKRNAKNVLRELNLLRSLRHPNIVRLVHKYALKENSEAAAQVPETMESIYHITLYCGQPLSTVISEGQYTMAEVKQWMKELLSALQYIHMLDIIHRDIQPGSMCISNGEDRKLILLGFGTARVADDAGHSSGVGKDSYMAIEVRYPLKKVYDETVDIWSMAVVFCEMITGAVLFTWRNARDGLRPIIEYCGPVEEAVLDRFPNPADRPHIEEQGSGKERKDFGELLRGMLLGNRTIQPRDIDDEPHLRSFIDRTLQYNPSARMSAAEALDHRFLHVMPEELPQERSVSASDEDEALRSLREDIFREINPPALPALRIENMSLPL